MLHTPAVTRAEHARVICADRQGDAKGEGLGDDVTGDGEGGGVEVGGGAYLKRNSQLLHAQQLRTSVTCHMSNVKCHMSHVTCHT